MEDLLKNYNKTFENRIRLGIMSTLVVNHELNFNALKQFLDATDGNLASHLNYLEKNNFIKHSKEFIGRKTNTKYTITKLGKKSFQNHIDALEKLLDMTKSKNK